MKLILGAMAFDTDTVLSGYSEEAPGVVECEGEGH